jgi:hypothetical protein
MVHYLLFLISISSLFNYQMPEFPYGLAPFVHTNTHTHTHRHTHVQQCESILIVREILQCE